MSLRVSLGFARLSDTELDNFSQAGINEITGNAAYPTPPVLAAKCLLGRFATCNL